LQETSYPLGSTSAFDTGIVRPTARPNCRDRNREHCEYSFSIHDLSLGFANLSL
jgi:hypothetical protein